MAHPQERFHTPAAQHPSTIVAVVGESAGDALASLDGVTGVDALGLRGRDPALAASRIRASRAAWVVHDADPLAHVAAAWIELYEERSTLGALEAEVDDALARFAVGEAIMPDYYLVLDPGSAHTAWRHWWCGALGRFAPKRVLPAASPAHPGDHRVRRMLGALPSSRPWPEPASWLREVPFAIPDRVGLRA